MKPRVFVQVWCEIDPTLNLRMDRQTGAPAAGACDLLTRISPLGRFGISEALRLGAREVTAFALGDGHETALRHAMAAGASRLMRLQFTGPSDKAASVAGLADWFARETPDLVISDRLAGQVAARLGWAHLAGLDQLHVENGILTARRIFGGGAFERVTAKMPAIIRLQGESPRFEYVSRARIAQAARRSIEEISMRVSGPVSRNVEIGELQISRPRTRLGTASNAATPGKAANRLNALMGLGDRAQTKAIARVANPAARTPRQMADEFVRYLAHNDLLKDRQK